MLTRLIHHFFERLRGNPGVRRMHAELAAAGHRVARKRVWRLMQAAGLQGRHPRAWKKTTTAGQRPVPAPDLIARSFTAAQPNQKWCGDITYIKTWDGWAYVATVIDLHSPTLIGWAAADHMKTSLITDALDMAITHRRPPKGVIFHSGRGTQGPRVRHVLHRPQHSAVPRPDRHLLRQCSVRIILRDLQERAHPHETVAEP
jgi:putative transposase